MSKVPFPAWTEGFEFPPALLKLRASIEGTILPLYHQGCIAINSRGASIYGARRTLVRRMIMHIQHHEGHLLTVLADSVPAREIVTPMDPLEAFLQTRPFQGSLPRRVGFWTFNDRRQQQVLRVDPQLTTQAPPQRQVERTHRQIETALHARVQGLHALVHDIEQTVDEMPHDVMCKVPSSPPSLTCILSCVALFTWPGCFHLLCALRQMTMNSKHRSHRSR